MKFNERRTSVIERYQLSGHHLACTRHTKVTSSLPHVTHITARRRRMNRSRHNNRLHGTVLAGLQQSSTTRLQASCMYTSPAPHVGLSGV